jgi:hypothetical protein
MSFSKASIAVAVALTMSSAPVFAQTSSSASKLSVASAQADRGGASLGSENDLFGGSGAGGFIIPLLAIAAIVLGILAATSGGGDDLPTSP